MTSLFDLIDVNIMTEIFNFSTIKQKLLSFPLLSKSLIQTFSSAVFKNDELTLNNKCIEYIDRHNISISTDKTFSSITRVKFAVFFSFYYDEGFLPAMIRVLNYFSSINSFNFICRNEYFKSSQLWHLLHTASLVNIKILHLSVVISSGLTKRKIRNESNKLNLLLFPHLQSLTIDFRVADIPQLPIIGLNDFITRHQKIIELEINCRDISNEQWNELLLNPSALPKLTKLIFTALRFQKSNIIFEDVIESLAATIIPSTNQPRPLQNFSLINADLHAAIFHSLSRIPSLTNVEIDDDIVNVWLPSAYSELSPRSALKSLTRFKNIIFYTAMLQDDFCVTDHQLNQFLNVLSHASLISLQFGIPVGINLNCDSVKALSQLNKLQILYLALIPRKRFHNYENNLFDWTDSSMFTSWQFSSMSMITLYGFKLSRESFTVIAAATPNITTFKFIGVLGMHAAILCLLISHHWLNIESIESDDKDCPEDYNHTCYHEWRTLTFEDFYHTERKFPPHERAFLQLRNLQMQVCYCTTPEIWLQLLQLFENANLVHRLIKSSQPNSNTYTLNICD